MKIDLTTVFERDIDLIVIDEFTKNKEFANIFLKEVGLSGLELVSAYHSLMHPLYGESDITIIVSDGNKKYGILIENKIDAIHMEDQSGRYIKRGEVGISNGDYNSFFVFIIAPEAYLNSDEEAVKYENKVSYESILEFLKEKTTEYMKIVLFEKAIEKKDNGYIPIEDFDVTKFWQDYYDFVGEFYPQLNINKTSGARGARASWPTFNTGYKNIKVIHKSDRGYADLSFRGYGDKLLDLKQLIGDYLDDDMKIFKTGKSSAVRLKVPTVEFNKPFSFYEKEMYQIFDMISRLTDLVDKLPIDELY